MQVQTRERHATPIMRTRLRLARANATAFHRRIYRLRHDRRVHVLPSVGNTNRRLALSVKLEKARPPVAPYIVV